jgi:DeoR/GlpR family transcriptional regulator of sugar metabolism
MAGNRINETKLEAIIESLQSGTRTIHDLSVLTGLNKRTVYRYLAKVESRGHEIVKGLGKVSKFRILPSQNGKRQTELMVFDPT